MPIERAQLPQLDVTRWSHRDSGPSRSRAVQVEDNLTALRVLENEATKVQDPVQVASRALTVSHAQYRARTANYLTVITVQAALLNAERTAIQLLTRRMVASAAFVEALGGGWNYSQLPTK